MEGAEAFRIAVGAIPMLVLSLVAVTALRHFGAIDLLTVAISPLLTRLGIDPILILPTLTKYLAGGTAMMGVVDDMRRAGQISVELLNASAGFLISPFDLPGVAVLISAGRRVAAVWKPAAYGACVGIALRTVGHERGAFTGAVTRKTGLIEAAAGGFATTAVPAASIKVAAPNPLN